MKLDGIRVVDLSVFLPGPYMTMTLADHGAEVIKVEPPGGGDPTREIGERDGPETVYFRNLNRGKRSVVADLKSPAGREAVLTLCDTADVFVETFRPGAAARLGLDYGTLAARNPRLVYCSISAFGQTGPYRDRPAHDLTVEAMAGITGITLGADDRPAIPGVAIADMTASLQALSGILMALFRRERTGRGDHLDISMHEAVLTAAPNVLGPVLAEGRQPVPKHERSLGGSAFYRIYETADRRHIVLGGQEMKFVRNFLGLLGRLDLAPLCERGPGPHQEPVMEALAEAFRSATLAEWMTRLESLDLCYGPVATLPEALEDPHVLARNAVLTDEAGRRHLAPAIRFLEEPATPDLAAPALGAHSAAYLGPEAGEA